MSTLKRPTSVPWGRCQFFLSSIPDHGHQPNNRTAPETQRMSVRGATQNVLFVETTTSMSLCRLSTPIPSSNGESNTICNYERSVHVRIQCATYDIKTLFNSMMLNNMIRPIGIMRENKTKQEGSIEEQQAAKSQQRSKCENISIELVNDEIDSPQQKQQINTHDNFLSLTIGCVALVSTKPIPLLSMSIFRIKRKIPLKTSPNNEAPSNDNMALLQSCHKRQLVGRVIMFHSGKSLTTDFALSGNTSTDRDTAFRYRVASVLPQPGMAKEETDMLFLVLPSTRITIMDDFLTDESLNEEFNCDMDDEPPSPLERKPAMLSNASRLLMETIHCIRIKLQHGNANVSRSFLLTGPPGVGKTFAVKTALEESEGELPNHTLLISIAGSELLSQGNQQPSEASKALQSRFMEAVKFCSQSEDHVALIFLDECEALVSVESVAAMLASLLDKVSDESSIRSGWKQIIVVAASNLIDAVPGFIRRPGRLDREVVMSPPNAKERASILKSLLRSLQSKQKQTSSMKGVNILNQDDLTEVAEATVGYVAADLAALVRRAATKGIQLGTSQVTGELLNEAMADVGASALRDAALSAPPTTRWEDIAGDAGGAKTALRRAVEWPRTKRKAFESLGLVPPRGILLHGPPGCAKTTLARAAAGACGIAFFSLSPADVYASSYVGEAEAVIRRSFTLARSAAPCILFFDEIDAVLGSNTDNDGGMGGRGSSAEARVLSTFLNEMDGIDGSREDGVLVLGATNRPSTLDTALLRPGRFDKVIYVPPPDEIGRKSILEMQCKKWNCATTTDKDKKMQGNTSANDAHIINVDLLACDDVTGSMTGAEIVGACREASMLVLRKAMKDSSRNAKMTNDFLAKALVQVKPLLSDPNVLEEYTSFEQNRVSS